MMYRLLVNAPSERQEIVLVDESGYYFDASRVLWDERTQGPIPQNMLPAPPPPDVPMEVTFRQGMAVLIDMGLDDDIDQAFKDQLAQATASGNADAIHEAKLAMNDWMRSTAFRRDWPRLEQMRVAFGWTQEFVDHLFIEAATR